MLKIFDATIQQLTEQYLEEGRLSKSNKFSSLTVNADELENKFNEGVLNSAFEKISNTGWLKNPPVDTVKKVFTDVVNNIKDIQPRTIDELNDAIRSGISNTFSTPSYQGMLGRVLGNIILSPGLNVVTSGGGVTDSDVRDAVNNKLKDIEGNQGESGDELSDLEQKAVEYIQAGNDTTTKADLADYMMHNFKKEPSEVNALLQNLVQKGVITQNGQTLSATDDKATGSKVLEPTVSDPDEREFIPGDQDEEDETPLDYDSGVKDAFDEYRRTLDSDLFADI